MAPQATDLSPLDLFSFRVKEAAAQRSLTDYLKSNKVLSDKLCTYSKAHSRIN
jgi:hypothetical protein